MLPGFTGAPQRTPFGGFAPQAHAKPRVCEICARTADRLPRQAVGAAFTGTPVGSSLARPSCSGTPQKSRSAAFLLIRTDARRYRQRPQQKNPHGARAQLVRPLALAERHIELRAVYRELHRRRQLHAGNMHAASACAAWTGYPFGVATLCTSMPFSPRKNVVTASKPLRSQHSAQILSILSCRSPISISLRFAPLSAASFSS